MIDLLMGEIVGKVPYKSGKVTREKKEKLKGWQS
tara:strand:+ start:501 stop:602 length:102 start_codon:yes stop_codon:yes gene_type:complete